VVETHGKTPGIPRLPLYTGVLAAASLLVGVALGMLPLLWAAVMLLAAVVIVLTLIDPLIGLGAALLLGPTKPLTDYFVPELPLDLGQIALITALGTWLLHALSRHELRLPRSKINAPLLIFIGIAALSTLNALSLGDALQELVKWGQIALVMWLAIETAGRARWQWVIGFVLAAGAAQGAVGIWQFGLRGDGPEHFAILGGRFYRAYGSFEQPNPYAGFLGLVLPIALGLALGVLGPWARALWIKLKAARPVSFNQVVQGLLNTHLPYLLLFGTLGAVMLAGLLMSWSRGAWIGFGAAALTLLFAWPRKAWFGAALVIGSLVLGLAAWEFNLLPASISSRLTGFTEDFDVSLDVRGVDINDANYSVLERLAHWQAAREMARYHPLLGVGFGNYEAVYPAYALINWPYPLGHAHNIYLNTLAETGIIGVVAYLGFWISVVWFTWRITRQTTSWQRSIAVGLLAAWTHLAVHQLFDKLYVANIHLHLGALLGVLSILLDMQSETQRNSYG